MLTPIRWKAKAASSASSSLVYLREGINDAWVDIHNLQVPGGVPEDGGRASLPAPSRRNISTGESREPGTCELCMWCFTGGAYTSDEVSQVSVLINYQNHNISDCLSQNWIESNRIGDQINNRKQWWYPALVFQTLFIYWTLPAQPSPGFTEKGPKKRTYPASLLSESTLLMSDVRGEWPHY